MPAELVLGIVATVDLCFKYGQELRRLCSALKRAESEVSERALRLDNGWLRITHQLNFLRRVQHMMDEEHQEVYEQTLQMFSTKLEIVTLMLKRMVKSAAPQHQADDDNTCRGPIPISELTIKPQRFKYARQKESLDKAIEDLEIWQRTADLSWFLLLKIADPRVDAALARPDAHENGSSSGADSDAMSMTSTANLIPSTVMIRAGLDDSQSLGPRSSGLTLNPDELAKMQVSSIPYCGKQLVMAHRQHSNGNTSSYILNYIQCYPPSKYATIKKDTRDLARKLNHNDPDTFGLLSCKGFATESAEDSLSSTPVTVIGLGSDTGAGNIQEQQHRNVRFTLVFRIPSGLSNDARSLRELLVSTPAPKSLTARFDIARALARSVSYVHTFGFVHKSVRPESVICFSSSESQHMSIFLAGFENFRRDEGWTQRHGDDAVHKNMYRHPSRQGTNPREDYMMQHDIYSLGVCLLEIGLWRSFIEFDCTTMRESEEWLRPRLADMFGPKLASSSESQVAEGLRESGIDLLLALARNQLPGCMGTRYAEIVETCLTCLDPRNADFGDEREFEDEDGIRVGARYIEKVVLRLNMLSV
ncbi:hypothetical protein B0H66DRAFT_560058 [Apodospora peruviana]|uniref:Protein kinase domain-containing protein n=1 Tax=Apodospora peruviana TaxID=516989 RepID=A0AAE0M1P0_9PEZI|nr:hypothetical protein B0H66DRAFT_560058 [Apodospora peruviana]